MVEKTEIKGTLVPIGGNEDRGANEYNGLDFIEQGILSHVVKESGGSDAKIVVIPTASSIPLEVGDTYRNAFTTLHCGEVVVLNITERSEAEDAENLRHIHEAHCVMFSGGDQSRIVKFIGGSTMHNIIMDRYKNDEGFVVAGTSAGAMAMATEMIAGGSSQEAMLKGAVMMKKGMGFLPELIIDTHFIKRGRFGRMAEAVAMFPQLIGVGLSEDTGVVIKHGNECKVIGSGMVILFDASHLNHNSHSLLEPGTPMSVSNLVTHILANGDRFTIHNRTIDVLPLLADFV
jgi:cyanophycinase